MKRLLLIPCIGSMLYGYSIHTMQTRTPTDVLPLTPPERDQLMDDMYTNCQKTLNDQTQRGNALLDKATLFTKPGYTIAIQEMQNDVALLNSEEPINDSYRSFLKLEIAMYAYFGLKDLEKHQSISGTGKESNGKAVAIQKMNTAFKAIFNADMPQSSREMMQFYKTIPLYKTPEPDLIQ